MNGLVHRVCDRCGGGGCVCCGGWGEQLFNAFELHWRVTIKFKDGGMSIWELPYEGWQNEREAVMSITKCMKKFQPDMFRRYAGFLCELRNG